MYFEIRISKNRLEVSFKEKCYLKTGGKLFQEDFREPQTCAILATRKELR